MKRTLHSRRYSPQKLQCIWLAAVFCFLISTVAQSAARQSLHGNVPSAVLRLTPHGQPDSNTRLPLAIGLPLRNQGELTKLLQDLSDPKSPNYRNYLTPEQFTERFGPSEKDYQAVANFAESHGLTVTFRHSNRLILDVEGNVSNIEKALHVKIRTYRHPSEVRDFYAADVEPSIDLAVPILHIGGLNNYSIPHPNLHLKPAGLTAQVTSLSVGSGPSGTYAGGDFRAAYVPGATLTGWGQAVGLVQFDGYYANDIMAYRAQFGLPDIPLINVPINGGISTPGGNNSEVCLDIEMVMSMAPGVSAIYVYEAPKSSSWVDILNRMANDNLAKQLSCSWGGGSSNPTAEQIFQQMAAQGQSFFSASGDYDAFTDSISFPSDSPNITEVGATILTTDSSSGSYVTETVWNDGNGVGSGGGISSDFTIPAWQQVVSMANNQGSTSMRNVPDVAMVGDNIYVRYGNGQSGVFAGTSCAAPLWAAFTALVNQQSMVNTGATVGFINPAIYAIGNGSGNAASFHDTTTGNNFSPSSPTKFSAVTGYDLCTGWGTPRGTALINALAGPSDSFQVSWSSLDASGVAGGPFIPISNTYTLINTSSTSLTWSASATQSWATLSATSGTIEASGSATVIVSINAAANELAPGGYSATVAFTNLSTGFNRQRPVKLNVLQQPPPTISSITSVTGTQGQAFTYQITATNSPTSFGAIGLPAGLGINTVTGLISGTPATCGTSNVTISASNDGGRGSMNLIIIVSPPAPTITGPNYSLTTLCSFNRTNGANPAGGLVQGSDGYFYGTTYNGGASGYAGTVFKITSSGMLTTLYSFSGGNDGANPAAAPIQGSDGNFYGTTALGGSGDYGTVFSLTSSGSLTTLCTFGGSNGSEPFSGLLQGSDGNFYGTTEEGGSNKNGIVFKMTPIGALTTLYSFDINNAGGIQPDAGLLQGSDGNLYGTASYGGGNSDGTAFKITPSGLLTTLCWFTGTTGSTKGAAPHGSIIQGNDGNFYGTTQKGGNNDDGTVFRLTSSGSFTTLCSFIGTNGAFPRAGLVQAADGNYYGTTSGGGSGNGIDGTIFRITSDGTLTTIYFFSGSDGSDPLGGLCIGSDGNFYGTTYLGGASGYGTVFKLAPSYFTTANATGTAGQAFSYQIFATNNPTGYNATGLPDGLSVNPVTGLITGTPTASGTSNVTITASNGTGSGSATLIITIILPNPPVITSSTSATGLKGQAFTYQITATNSPNSFGASGLPAGLSVNAATGLIRGTPTESGTSDATIYAINAGGTGSANLTISVLAPVPIVTPNVSSFTTICSFTGTNGMSPGANPQAALVLGNDGNFYGTTNKGGSGKCGTAFKITSAGLLTSLCSFDWYTSGGYSQSSLVQAIDGNFYGINLWGGKGSYGVAYKVTPNGVLTVLYPFDAYSPDFYDPNGLVQGSDGNFYGTTYWGGANNSGEVFEMTASGSVTGLYAFSGSTGYNPRAGLVQGSDGNFYGTAYQGGSSNNGTIFKITPGGVPTLLCSFSGTNGACLGANPEAAVMEGLDGNFYGTTYNGGTGAKGTIFKMTPSGTLTPLCSFGGTNGANPLSALVQGSVDGDFYGTTQYGGNGNCGTIFKITSSGSLTTLYSFTGGNDGSNPYAGLVPGNDGNFYGTAYNGGANNCGTVFKITPPFITAKVGSAFSYQITATNTPTSYNATGLPAGLSVNTATGLISGAATASGTSIVTVSASNVYGTGSAALTIIVPNTPVITSSTTVTVTVGQAFNYQITATNNPTSYNATGLPAGLSVNTTTGLISGIPTVVGTTNVTITASNSSGTASAALVINALSLPAPVIQNLVTLCSFTGTSGGCPGATPYSGVIIGSDGNLYGTTQSGGSSNCGTVFKITSNGSVTSLFSFNGTNGSYVLAGLTQGIDGNFYGTTEGGGAGSCGTVYRMTPSGALTTLYSFGSGGTNPYAGLVQGADGCFYGETAFGGIGSGSIFKITSGGSLTWLHFFGSHGSSPPYFNTDGVYPYNNLVKGSDGAFYGTAAMGGTNSYGTIFKITSSGSFTPIYAFNSTDGSAPNCKLTQGIDGNFYGTTNARGSYGYGTIFKMTPNGSLSTLYSFDSSYGSYPINNSLTEGNDGGFYGITGYGGSGGYGTIFEITSSGSLTTLCAFTGSNVPNFGAYPKESLTLGTDGIFYGTTSGGGSNNLGTVFKYIPQKFTATIGAPFSYQITATNSPSSYNATGLPMGLSVNPATGLVSGTPIASGTSNITITASNSSGMATASLSITVVPPLPVITSTLVATGTSGAAFSYQIAATNSPMSYGADGLPLGLSMNATTGHIGGTPSLSGTSSATISATNAGGTGSASLIIIVQPSFIDWRNLWFTASEAADPTISGESASPARDGIPNLLKYAFNMNPKANGASGLPGASIVTSEGCNYLMLNYIKVITATDITYIPEVSSDLQNWYFDSGSVELVSVTDNADGMTQTVLVKDLKPINSSSARFFRLRITKP